MTHEAERLLAEALKKVKLGGGFSPADVGGKIGLNRPQAELAARALSNAGILILGFDGAAHFSPAYRKQQSPASSEPSKGKKAKRPVKRSAARAGAK